MKKIAVFGAGGFGREVHMIIDQINQKKIKHEFIGYFDDTYEPGEIINDFPVLGGVHELNQWSEPLEIVCAVGDPKDKKSIIENIKNENVSYPVLIHPTALIGNMKFNSIGEGSIITAGVVVTVNIALGKHVILNLACTIGHNTRIGDYGSFMPTVNISGDVVIEKGVYVGTGAQIINKLTIGENTIIGAGAVVAETLPPNCTAVGMPAKPVKFH